MRKLLVVSCWLLVGGTFAFPLLVEIFREELSTETLDARVARMVEALEREATATGSLT